MVRYREDLTRLVDTVLSGPGKTTSELRRAVEARAGALSGRQGRSSPDLCVKAEEAPRLRLGCLGDLLFLEE